MDGEQWCPSCEGWRRYRSHGWNTSAEGGIECPKWPEEEDIEQPAPEGWEEGEGLPCLRCREKLTKKMYCGDCMREIIQARAEMDEDVDRLYNLFCEILEDIQTKRRERGD